MIQNIVDRAKKAAISPVEPRQPGRGAATTGCHHQRVRRERKLRTPRIQTTGRGSRGREVSGSSTSARWCPASSPRARPWNRPRRTPGIPVAPPEAVAERSVSSDAPDRPRTRGERGHRAAGVGALSREEAMPAGRSAPGLGAARVHRRRSPAGVPRPDPSGPRRVPGQSLPVLDAVAAVTGSTPPAGTAAPRNSSCNRCRNGRRGPGMGFFATSTDHLEQMGIRICR